MLIDSLAPIGIATFIIILKSKLIFRTTNSSSQTLVNLSSLLFIFTLYVINFIIAFIFGGENLAKTYLPTAASGTNHLLSIPFFALHAAALDFMLYFRRLHISLIAFCAVLLSVFLTPPLVVKWVNSFYAIYFTNFTSSPAQSFISLISFIFLSASYLVFIRSLKIANTKHKTHIANV